MAPGDKRRNLRRAISYPAFIDLGDNVAPRECLLCDVSKEGALLTVAEPTSLPDEFTLALSVDGAARRRCRIAWRSKDQIGVSFSKDFKDAPVRPLDVSHDGALPSVEAPELEPAADPAGDMFDIDTLTRT
jgi:hypothetical protein